MSGLRALLLAVLLFAAAPVLQAQQSPAGVAWSSLSSEQLKPMAHGGPPFHTELGFAHDLTYVDLPTGHWPMFSRPADLAAAIAQAART